MSQHAGLDPARWASFDLDQQILMIGNEMNRASRWLAADGGERLLRGYERVLRLTDLTVSCNTRATLRRELLRWRDLVAELYMAPDAERHRAAFRALLLLSPTAARQLGLLSGVGRR